MAVHRNTMQKEITYDAVAEYMGHPNAEEVYEIVNKKYPTISKATVYRNLKTLAEEGKLRRIESHSKLTETRYDLTLSIHSHGVCAKCGKIVDVDVLGEENIEVSSISREDGFELLSHEIIFEGICKECRANKEN
ncbi:MAG: transcriptional repressor [Spirochaetales bacterium]|nr:transcriptional repressor [Spirochaetales bacterium]